MLLDKPCAHVAEPCLSLLLLGQVAEMAQRGAWHPKVSRGDNPDKRYRLLIPLVFAAQVRLAALQICGVHFWLYLLLPQQLSKSYLANRAAAQQANM